MNAHAVLDALAEQRGEGAAISAITLNLVAFVEDPALLDWISQRTDAIAQKHASRSIFLDASQAGEGHSVHTEHAELDGTILTRCEQVRLGARECSATELRSLVHDLLVPDVETVLLWAGSTLEDDRFAALVELCGVVIMDSSRSRTGPETLHELARLADERLERAIRDLAYMRLLPWQDLVALFFDDPRLALELPELRAVEVDAGSEAEAYYLLGWLASRLAWQPCGHNSFCNADASPIEVRISHGGEPRRVQSIALHSAKRTFTAALHPKNPDLVCLSVEGERRSQRCAPLRHIDTISLIARAMLTVDNGEVFVETLHMVRTLLEKA